MRVSEDEIVQVPAAWLALRTAFLHCKESRKQRDESLAPALAPVAPNADLPRIYAVVRKLRRPGINHHAQPDVSLLQLLPQQVHLGFLPRDTALHPQRRIAGLIRFRLRNFAIRPRRTLQVELVAAVPQVEVIPAKPDQVALEELKDVVG